MRLSLLFRTSPEQFVCARVRVCVARVREKLKPTALTGWQGESTSVVCPQIGERIERRLKTRRVCLCVWAQTKAGGPPRRKSWRTKEDGALEPACRIEKRTAAARFAEKRVGNQLSASKREKKRILPNATYADVHASGPHRSLFERAAPENTYD